jgi:hypothetical protein
VDVARVRRRPLEVARWVEEGRLTVAPARIQAAIERV